MLRRNKGRLRGEDGRERSVDVRGVQETYY